MPPNSPEKDIENLMKLAEGGGPDAAKAARAAAALSELRDPERAAKALAIAARLDPLDATPKLALARLHAEKGDLGAARLAALTVLGDAVDEVARARAAFMLGEIARAEGDNATARTRFEQALKIEDKLLATDRTNPTAARWFARCRGRLAELDAAEGNLDRARAGSEGALAMLRATAAQLGEPPVLAADIADAELRLGALDLDTGDVNVARRRCAEAIARYEALVMVEPDEPHWRGALADAWALAAEADFARHAHAEARAAMDKALGLRIKLVQISPSERWALAAAWRLRAALLAAMNDAEGAAQSIVQARALGEAFCAEAQGAEAPARFLIHTTLDQADHALRHNQLALAREAADAARLRAEAFARATNAPVWQSEVGACWDRLGEAARLAGANSLDPFARAVECRRMARDGDATNAPLQRALAAALMKYGDAMLKTREARGARVAFNEAVAIRLALAQADPGMAPPVLDLAIALEHLGLAAQATGDSAAARNAWQEELALAERLYPDEHHPDGMRFRAIVEAHLASLGGPHGEAYRQNALARLDLLARDGVLSERDAQLRKSLWKP